MSFTAPPLPIGTTPNSSNAEGFLLLTISNCTISSTSPAHPINGPSNSFTGLLSLECVTLLVADPGNPSERDVWLVLRVESQGNTQSVELPLPATQSILLSRELHRYTIPMKTGGGGELVVTLGTPQNNAQKEDYETLEVILAQYAVLEVVREQFQPPPTAPPGYNEPSSSSANQYPSDPDGDLKGRLVLVDEDDGRIVGTLGDEFEIREDPNVRAEGREKDPVLIDIPEEGGSRRQLFVHPVPVDNSDWISRTTGLLR